jgi:hypothetical protein
MTSSTPSFSAPSVANSDRRPLHARRRPLHGYRRRVHGARPRPGQPIRPLNTSRRPFDHHRRRFDAHRRMPTAQRQGAAIPRSAAVLFTPPRLTTRQQVGDTLGAAKHGIPVGYVNQRKPASSAMRRQPASATTRPPGGQYRGSGHRLGCQRYATLKRPTCVMLPRSRPSVPCSSALMLSSSQTNSKAGPPRQQIVRGVVLPSSLSTHRRTSRQYARMCGQLSSPSTGPE